MSNLNSTNNINSKPIPTEAKKHYQIVWKILFLIITIVTSLLLNQVYIYQTDPKLNSVKKGDLFSLLVYGSLCGFIFILFQTLAHYFLDQKCQKYYLSYERYQTQIARKKRAYTLVKWAYSVIYYAITSIAAYLILLETTYMPTWLGGNGYCADLTRYINSFDEANSYMNIFYLIQFGKHIGRFFHHIFIRPEGNFYQYALHHGLSTFLIFFSYLTNLWLVGIFKKKINLMNNVTLFNKFDSFNFILGIIYHQFICLIQKQKQIKKQKKLKFKQNITMQRIKLQENYKLKFQIS